MNANASLPAAVIAALTAGCYGTTPPVPPRYQPTLTDDGVAVLDVRNRDAYLDRRGYIHGPTSSMHFEYAGEARTYGEYRAIVDPKWNATIDHYADLKDRCKHTRIPMGVGITMIAAGVAFGMWGANLIGEGKEDLQRNIFYGTALAGAAVWYTGSIFFGGRACSEAEHMWEDHPWLQYAKSTSIPTFAAARSELHDLTRDFNARNRATAKTEPSAEP
jgi:hypothetical protein